MAGHQHHNQDPALKSLQKEIEELKKWKAEAEKRLNAQESGDKITLGTINVMTTTISKHTTLIADIYKDIAVLDKNIQTLSKKK